MVFLGTSEWEPGGHDGNMQKNSPILFAVYPTWDAMTRHDNYALLIQDKRFFELKDRKTLMQSVFYVEQKLKHRVNLF